MQNEMNGNTQALQAMNGNLQNMEKRMNGNMQNMVRNFSSGIRTEHGEMTESRGSVEAVWTAMETGKVELMSDATIIKGETCKLGQVETKSQELKEVTEMQKSKEGDKLHETKVKEEHTQVELVGDIEVERVECFETQCEGRINLPQE